MILSNKTWMSFVAASCAAVSVLAAAPFSSLLEEDVNIFVSVRSFAETRAAWEGHPLAEVFEDTELQAFLEPLLGANAGDDEESMTEVLKNEFGLTWDELFELFSGQMALAWFNLPEMVLEQADQPDMQLMAEYAGEPERLMELMQIQFERNAESQRKVNPAMEHTLIEETFMGETLYFDEAFDGEKTYIEDGYALVDGIFILAVPEARLRSAVEAIKDTPDAPLGENAAYLRAREKGGRGDLAFYMNLETILPPLNAELLGKSMASGAAMFGLSAQSLDAALSLESMQALFFDLDLTEGGLSSHSGVLYREKTGLMRLFTYSGDPLPEARYVPRGVFSSSVTTFDSGAMLAALEALLTAASPTMPIMVDMQMQTIRTNTGVDLRTAVLENLAGDLVSLSILPEQAREATAMLATDQVFVINLNDSEAFSSALEALKDLVPGMRAQIQAQDFAGQTIHTFKPVQAPGVVQAEASLVSYVVSRTQLIVCIGRLGLLQEVLTAMDAGGDGFWQLAATEALFEAFEPTQSNTLSRSYMDVEKILLPIFQSMVQASQLGGEAVALDKQSIPSNIDVPFHMISELSEAEDGLFTRALLIQREATK